MIDQHRDNNEDDDECWHHLTEPSTTHGRKQIPAFDDGPLACGGPARLWEVRTTLLAWNY